MSIYSLKEEQHLKNLALAKCLTSPGDLMRGYNMAKEDVKQFSAADSLYLAKALFRCSGVNNTWEKLLPGAQAKHISDANYLASSMGFKLE